LYDPRDGAITTTCLLYIPASYCTGAGWDGIMLARAIGWMQIWLVWRFFNDLDLLTEDDGTDNLGWQVTLTCEKYESGCTIGPMECQTVDK